MFHVEHLSTDGNLFAQQFECLLVKVWNDNCSALRSIRRALDDSSQRACNVARDIGGRIDPNAPIPVRMKDLGWKEFGSRKNKIAQLLLLDYQELRLNKSLFLRPIPCYCLNPDRKGNTLRKHRVRLQLSRAFLQIT